jgi:hypothetical protein
MRTFRVVEASHQTDGDGYGIHDPMVANSITSQALHDRIVAEFEAKGYRYSPESADFDVQYRATVAPVLDVRSYGLSGYGYGSYGYRYNGYYDWGYCCGYDPFGYAEASYDRETVIIDAVEPKSGKLLWRGQGTSDGYDNPKKYMKTLAHAVHAVTKKFPVAGWSPAAIAAR